MLGTPPDTISISERFDIVIGSGRKGQTYLYWGKKINFFNCLFPIGLSRELGKQSRLRRPDAGFQPAGSGALSRVSRVVF